MSQSSDFSFESDMEEGTIVGSILPSMQDSVSIQDSCFDSVGSIPSQNQRGRFSEYQERLALKHEQRVQEEYQREMANCTFKPSTNNKSTSRPFQDFLKEQNKFLVKREEKVQELKDHLERQEANSSCFKPSLCEKSVQLLVDRAEGSVFEKLYSRSRTPSAEWRVTSFQPTINKRSQQLKRPVDIASHLYSQAFKAPKPATELQPPPRLVNKTSEQYLAKKLTHSLEKTCIALDITHTVSYSLFLKVLEEMQFIHPSPTQTVFHKERMLTAKAWSVLAKGTSEVLKEDLNEFLQKVMGYTSSPLHTEFAMFARNRNSLNTKPKTPQTFSFKPELSPNTVALANNKREKRGDMNNFLVTERQKLQEKWKRIRMEREIEEVKSLTFTPQVNSFEPSKTTKQYKNGQSPPAKKPHRTLSLYSLALSKKANAEQKREDVRNDFLHETMKQCTFKPRRTRHFHKDKKPGKEAKGVAEVVQRLRAARIEKERLSETLRKDGTFNFGLGHNKTDGGLSFRSVSQSRFTRSRAVKQTRVESSESDESEDGLEVELQELLRIPAEDREIAVDSLIAKYQLKGDAARQLKAKALRS